MLKIGSICIAFFVAVFFLHQKIGPHFFLLKADNALTWRYRADLEDKEKVKQILEKPLTLLGSGSQCYAFLSEDEKYVVKICKASRYRSFFTSKGKEKKESDFLSYFLAFHFLPEQSQIVFLHLNKTKHLKSTLKVVDPFGFTHVLNADDMAFYIQKKATLLSDYLKELSHSESRRLARELLKLFQSCSEDGLQIRDIYPKNIGVYNGSPFWIDPGRIKAKPLLRNKEMQKKELFRFKTLLIPNLRQDSLSFSDLVEEEFEAFF